MHFLSARDIRSFFLIIVSASILSGCVISTSKTLSERGQAELLTQYHVTEVIVEPHKKYNVKDMFRVQGRSGKEAANYMMAIIKERTETLVKPKFKGPRPAKLRLQMIATTAVSDIETIRMDSAGYVSGIATLIDAKSGEVIAEEGLQTVEKGFNLVVGPIPVTRLIKSDEDRAKIMAEQFAAEILNWATN